MISGCQCAEGFVRNELTGKCIKRRDCPCFHGGKKYNEGETVSRKCNKWYVSRILNRVFRRYSQEFSREMICQRKDFLVLFNFGPGDLESLTHVGLLATSARRRPASRILLSVEAAYGLEYSLKWIFSLKMLSVSALNGNDYCGIL